MQNKIFIEGKIHSISQEQKFIKIINEDEIFVDINLEEIDKQEIRVGDCLRIAGKLMRGGLVLATSMINLSLMED